MLTIYSDKSPKYKLVQTDNLTDRQLIATVRFYIYVPWVQIIIDKCAITRILNILHMESQYFKNGIYLNQPVTK